MNELLLSVRLFLKNKAIFFAYFLLVLLINCVQLYGLQFFNQDILASFTQLQLTLRTSIFYFAFYIFLSLEYCYTVKSFIKNDSSSAKSTIRLYINIFLVLMLLNLITTIIYTIYNISVFFTIDIIQHDFLFHVLISMLLNFFIVAILAILMGMCLALTFKRPVAYLFSIIFIFFTSPAFEFLKEVLYYNYNINLYPVFNIFDLYTPSLIWVPNFYFGYSLLPYRFALLFIWIFVVMAILLYKLISQKAIKIISAAICIVLFSLSTVVYFQPSSKLVMNYDPDAGLDTDLWYYNESEQKEEAGGFDVLDYTMNINVTHQLNVKANLKVSDNLSEYKFTLYHGYKITSICNQDEVDMKYDQDGDYFIVYNDGVEVDELKVEYSGYSTKFYSNSQGMILPGFFPYYPHSGFHRVYDIDNLCFEKLFLDSASEFHITVSGNKQIYSNLNKTEKNEFNGNATSITIVSGFVTSQVVEGIELIYPYMDTTNFSNESIENYINQFINEYRKSQEVEKIIILPNLNLINTDTVIYDGYITTNGLYGLAAQCTYIEMNPDKKRLIDLTNAYLYSPDYFNYIVSLEDSDNNSDAIIAVMISEKIEKLGTEEFVRILEEYLYNDDDLRTVPEFLDDL